MLEYYSIQRIAHTYCLNTSSTIRCLDLNICYGCLPNGFIHQCTCLQLLSTAHLILDYRYRYISVCNQPARSTQPFSPCGTVKWVLSGWVIINGDGGRRFWQPVQADSQPKSSGLVLGRRPLGAVLHSLNEPGELSQWLFHGDSTINIVFFFFFFFFLLLSSAGFRSYGEIQWIISTSNFRRTEKFCSFNSEQSRGQIRCCRMWYSL